MEFVADFHVHSHYSRATARSLDLEGLYQAAQLKGVQVVGTGDATHPDWLAEIKEKLLPAEEGLYRLKPELAKSIDAAVPPACRGVVRFMLVSEISNIYRRDGNTRKNHNLVFMPDIASAEIFAAHLERIGNIRSDGRPILGLDARDLLQLQLEVQPQGFLVPAHIWTPWFSLFGSRSGFDRLEECFGDLSCEIFAVETGLSSDPPMNWRVSALDRLTLLSNSDAHSPMKLGREANRFNTELSFAQIKEAIRSRDPAHFKGTIEFYPEEGKYHLDGHRKCGLCQHPDRTRLSGETCPTCGKPLTLGVLHRVEQLADRPPGYQLSAAAPFTNLIPLTEIISELLAAGCESKGVQRIYQKLLGKLGPELTILLNCPAEQIEQAGVPLLAEAIGRMRRAEVHLQPGFDGEYGRVRVFSENERQQLLGQQALFKLPLLPTGRPAKGIEDKEAKKTPFLTAYPEPRETHFACAPVVELPHIGGRDGLNAEQRAAIELDQQPLLIKAGPGTGKTHTLTHAIAHAMQVLGIPAEALLAVTFTQRAAAEMRHRLKTLLPPEAQLPLVGTFHAVCRRLLAENDGRQPTIADEHECLASAMDALDLASKANTALKLNAAALLQAIGRAKQALLGPTDDLQPIFSDYTPEQRRAFAALYADYERVLALQGRCDFDTLIVDMARRLAKDDAFRQHLHKRFCRIFVDEYQDLNQAQHTLLLRLTPASGVLVAIGDPDQSIYGFRGCDPSYFAQFMRDFPHAHQLSLWRNYRSSATIVQAARQVLAPSKGQKTDTEALAAKPSGHSGYPSLTVLQAADERQEASAIARHLLRLVGGSGYHSRDTDGIDPDGGRDCSYGDIAVLYRLQQQSAALQQRFDRAGIPWQLAGKEALSSHAQVADQLALLRLLEGVGSFADLQRTSQRLGCSVGKRAFARFKLWCLQHDQPVALALERARRFPIAGMAMQDQKQLYPLLTELGTLRETMRNLAVSEKMQHIRQRLAGLAEGTPNPALQEVLVQLAQDAGEDVVAFLAAVSQQHDGDWYASRAQRVTLMTLHASKGLEFPVVFICGCEQGLIPLDRNGASPTDADEECRLFYVAVTRAKERLFLTHTRRRRIHGRQSEVVISPFVKRIDAALIEYDHGDSNTRRRQRQLSLF